MSYRNPRFSYAHEMADQGDAAFHEVDTDPDFTEARTRLFDYQRGLLASQPDVTSATIGVMRFDKDTSLSTGAHQLLRLIIPPGHNLALDRCFRFKLDATVPEVDPSDAIDWFCVSGNQFPIVIDLEDIEANRYATQLNWEYTESFTSLPFNVGELWWTNLVQTVQGIQQSQWPDNQIPTLTQTQMLDGSTFNRVDGPPRRRLNLTHVRASAADLKLYEELTRRTAYGARPFWYEHPDSGGAVTEISELSDHTTDIPSSANCTLSTVSTGAPDGATDSIKGTSDASGQASMDVYLDTASTSLDCRNLIFQFDIKLDATAATWLLLDSDLRLLVVNDDPYGYAVMDIGSAFIKDTRSTEWIRFQIHMQDFDTELGNDGLNQAAGWKFTFIWQPDAITQPIEISSLNVIDATKLPVQVEIVPGSISRDQSSPAPKSGPGPVYDISMQMIEVTS